MTTNEFLLLLEREDLDIRRKYDKASLEGSAYWPALEALARQPDLVSSFCPASVTARIFAERDRLFFDFQPVPWYLDILGNALIDNVDSTPCWVVIKACNDHRFYDLYGTRNEDGREIRKLLCEPVFDPTRKRDDKVALDADILRGLADTLLLLAPEFLNVGPAKSEALYQWFQLSLHVKAINKEPDGTCRLNVAADMVWSDSAVDRNQQSITIYSLGKTNVKPVLMASANFRSAVSRLSEVWHDAAARSVILSAGAGSGKEELKEILAYGLRLEKPECLIQLSAPELAGASPPLEDIYKALEKRELISIDHKKHTVSPQRVVLFFDEIHHSDVKRLRTLLLRMMESSQLPTNGKRPLDCKKILYLFAASKAPDKLKATCPPPDFWTRLEHTIVMRHPLDLETKDERREVLRQYFCMFWRQAAEARTDKATDRIVKELGSEHRVSELAVEFADSLSSPLIPLISIRILRSITFRPCSKAIYRVRIGKPPAEPLKEFIAREVKPNSDRWIVEIVKELAPEIKPEGLF